MWLRRQVSWDESLGPWQLETNELSVVPVLEYDKKEERSLLRKLGKSLPTVLARYDAPDSLTLALQTSSSW